MCCQCGSLLAWQPPRSRCLFKALKACLIQQSLRAASQPRPESGGHVGTACSYMADSLYVPFLVHFIDQPCHELPQFRLGKLKTSRPQRLHKNCAFLWARPQQKLGA